MKQLFLTILMLISLITNSYALDGINKQMLDRLYKQMSYQGFTVYPEGMKIPHAAIAWHRDMTRPQCDIFVDDMLKKFNLPKKTNVNFESQRIESIMGDPGMVLGCFENTASVVIIDIDK